LNLFLILDLVRNALHQKRWTPERALGARGEDLAMRFLQKNGYVIVARNYRPRSGKGEVDLIGWEGEALAFVEVKTRQSGDTGAPERAVHPEKQRNVVRAARAYARSAKVNWDMVRFDVLTVIATATPKIELYRDAFGSTEAAASRNSPYVPAPSGSYPPA